MKEHVLLGLTMLTVLLVIAATPYFVNRAKVVGYREGYALIRLNFECTGSLPDEALVERIAGIMVRNRWTPEYLNCSHIQLIRENSDLSFEEMEALLIRELRRKRPLFKVY